MMTDSQSSVLLDDQPVTCPTAPAQKDGTPHTVMGCGSHAVQPDPDEDGMFDCLDCGMFFTADAVREDRQTGR